MSRQQDTTRKLNPDRLARRGVLAANVLASMALPVQTIETTSLFGRFETATESLTYAVQNKRVNRQKIIVANNPLTNSYKTNHSGSGPNIFATEP